MPYKKIKNYIFKDPLNTEYLSNLTKIIYESTGLRVVFKDPDNNPLYSEEFIQETYHSSFCKLIWGSEIGRKRCDACDRSGASKSLKEKRPNIYKCHAGLMDIASVVIYKDTHIATILTGEFLLEPPDETGAKRIRKLNRDLGIDLDILEDAYYRVKVVPEKKMLAIEKFLNFFTDYLIKSETLKENYSKHLKEVQEKSRLKLALKEMKISEILSKLDPHFIFNTLNIIPWFIKFKRYDDATDVVYSLSKLLRESFGKKYKDEEIRFKDEIELLKLYLKIQKYRFEDRLKYKFKIEEEVLNIKIPRLIVQPIIENSINHGFTESLPLNIDIESYIDDNYLMIKVSDNGKGIEVRF